MALAAGAAVVAGAAAAVVGAAVVAAAVVGAAVATGAFVVVAALVQRRPDLVFVHRREPLLAPDFVHRPLTDAADAAVWNAPPTNSVATDMAPRARM